jgi:hypothetical protein
MTPSKSGAFYEVLSPWAEADPIPLHGLAPRLAKLDGKKIGLLQNSKEKFPTTKISRFEGRSFSVSSLEPERKTEFEDWLKGLDAVIAAVGD